MKRILFTLITMLAVSCLSLMAADKGAEIEFDTVKHDFGTIKASNGVVTATYRFTNTGTKPLVIVKVTNGGCGCTTPAYPKQPISPGQSGEVTINFNPAGRRGEFNREVKVTTNASKKRTALNFSGVIIP